MLIFITHSSQEIHNLENVAFLSQSPPPSVPRCTLLLVILLPRKKKLINARGWFKAGNKTFIQSIAIDSREGTEAPKIGYTFLYIIAKKSDNKILNCLDFVIRPKLAKKTAQNIYLFIDEILFKNNSQQ